MLATAPTRAMTDLAVAKNIAKLEKRIRIASQNCGRDARQVTLLAVAKTKPAAAVREAAVAGDEVSNGKPHPEPYAKAAADLGVEPDERIDDRETGGGRQRNLVRHAERGAAGGQRRRNTGR